MSASQSDCTGHKSGSIVSSAMKNDHSDRASMRQRNGQCNGDVLSKHNERFGLVPPCHRFSPIKSVPHVHNRCHQHRYQLTIWSVHEYIEHGTGRYNAFYRLTHNSQPLRECKECILARYGSELWFVVWCNVISVHSQVIHCSSVMRCTGGINESALLQLGDLKAAYRP